MKPKLAKATLLLDPCRVKPFKDQPRKRFRGIKQLAGSIRLVGQVTPIVVTPCAEKGFDAELIDGERRLQACRLGKMQIEAVVQAGVEPGDRFALAVAANFCHQKHDALEIARAIDTLRSQGRTLEEIGGIFGKTGAFVSQHHSLLRLPGEVQRMLAGPADGQSRAERRAAGKMTFTLALTLLPFDAATQLRAARQIAGRKMSLTAARRYIRGLGQTHRVKVGRTVTAPNRLNVFWRATEVYRCAVDRLAELPYGQLAPLLQALPAGERRAMAAHLDTVRGALAIIAGELRKAEAGRK